MDIVLGNLLSHHSRTVGSEPIAFGERSLCTSWSVVPPHHPILWPLFVPSLPMPCGPLVQVVGNALGCCCLGS